MIAAQPDYKHSYDEDSFDDEGNGLGKQLVYCVDGKLCTDWDRNADGEVEPVWFLNLSTEEPAPCRVCSGEVKPGYAPPASVRVTMPYVVAKVIESYVGSGVGEWDHDNENACQDNPDVSEHCSLCIVGEWLKSDLRPAMADRPVKKSKRKRR